MEHEYTSVQLVQYLSFVPKLELQQLTEWFDKYFSTQILCLSVSFNTQICSMPLSQWKRESHLRLKQTCNTNIFGSNEKFDNIKPTHNDNTTAAEMMTLAQFNVELVQSKQVEPLLRRWAQVEWKKMCF